MNPYIAFAIVSESAWSIILVSGTLARIDSLETELGCKLDKRIFGGHVIDPSRVLASTGCPKKVVLGLFEL